MNFSRTPEDSTVFVRVMRDFDVFLKNNKDETRSSRQTLFSDDSISSIDNAVQLLDDSNTQSQLDSINKDSRNSKRALDFEKSSELYRQKSTIARLESRLNSLDVEAKRSRIEIQQEISTKDSKILDHKEREEELARRLNFMVEREKTNKEQFELNRVKADKLKSDFEDKIERLMNEKITVTEELSQKISTLEAERHDAEDKLHTCQLEKLRLENRLNETETILQQHEKLCDRLTKQVGELENYQKTAMRAKLKITTLEIENDKFKRAMSLSSIAKSQLDKVRELEEMCTILKEENRRLSENKKSIMLLNEQVDGLKAKLGRADAFRTENVELKSKIEELKTALSKWMAIDDKSLPVCPENLVRTVSELQQKNSLLLEEKGELLSRLNQQVNDHSTISGKCKVMQEELIQFKEKSQIWDETKKRLERRLLFITKERDGIRRVINSFNAENMPEQVAAELLKAEKDLATCYKRIQDLEMEMELQKKAVKSEKLIPVGKETSDDAQTKELSSLRERIAGLLMEKEEWLAEKEKYEMILERRRLQGDYDPTKTKVIHCLSNPTSVAVEVRKNEFEHLRSECARLKAIVLGFESSDYTAKSIVHKEIQELREQLSNAEKFNLRLKEVIRERIRVFREACYVLTGYRIDGIDSNRYKLQSIYAEHPDDCLIFDILQGGKVSQLETEFSKSVDDILEKYTTTSNSIPAFLSAVTLQLYSQQTMQLMSHAS